MHNIIFYFFFALSSKINKTVEMAVAMGHTFLFFLCTRFELFPGARGRGRFNPTAMKNGNFSMNFMPRVLGIGFTEI